MKKTKHALLLSAVSMLLCLSMLVGSTFAWFTDTASTGVNKIVAGNLDVSLEMSNDKGVTWVTAEGTNLGFVKNADGNVIADTEEDPLLWEPGCTYILQPAKVVNNGNLAFKYEILVSAVGGLSEDAPEGTEQVDLAEVIEVKVDGETKGTLRNLLNTQAIIEGVILPAGKTAPEGQTYIKSGEATLGEITLYMKETAGNQYMNQTLENIAVTVYATQYTYEEDSFDDQYDVNANYVGSDPNKLKIIGNGTAFYDEEAKTYTIIHEGETKDYVGATIDLTEGYDATKSQMSWSRDGKDSTWLIETERSTYFIQNINGREIYQLWVAPGNVMTYWFDINGDGTTDFTVVFNAMNATKTN